MKLSVDANIARARTLPTEYYRSADYFEQSKEKIFARSWQWVGDTDQVKEPGWTTPFELLPHYLREPLLLTRDKKNEIHCLSNACTHRGNLVADKPCKVNELRCKYHGRRFQLDGQFISMPEFKEVENFPTPDDHLARLPLFQLGKWLFTQLEKGAPAGAYFQPMLDRIGWMPFDQFVFHPELSRDYTVQANWALYCENYLEGFHIPFVHAGLNSVIDYSNYAVELHRYSSLQVGVAKPGELVFDLTPASPDYGKKIGGYYFWVFPNLMFNFYPWGLSINVVKPVTPSSCVVSFIGYVWNESYLRQGAGGDLHKVELEDEEVVQNVQRGIQSRFYRYGRYSATREPGTHHFHRLIAECIEGSN